MKYLKLTFILFVLLLFGCNQPNSKNTLATEEKLADTASLPPLKQEKAGSSVLRIKFSAKTPRHRKLSNRYQQG
jgi:hypothetical protein